MRERFILACRIFGLVIFCFGLMTTALSLRVFVDRYDISKAMPQSLVRDLDKAASADLKEEWRRAEAYTWRWICVTFLVGSVAPLALGLYLMKSGGVFVRLCYPEENAATARPLRAPPQMQLEEETKEPQTADDSKYMPPGYEK